MPGVCELVDLHPRLHFDQGLGQHAPSCVGLVRMDGDPLRATGRQQAGADRPAIESSRLHEAGDSLALEQALDHLRFAEVAREGDLDQIGTTLSAAISAISHRRPG